MFEKQTAMEQGAQSPPTVNKGHVNDSLFIVHADVGLRQNIIAETLGLALDNEAHAWQDTVAQDLQVLLEDRFEQPVTLQDARRTKAALSDHIRSLRATSVSQGRKPYVIALDPAFAEAELVDYTFQETRVSIIDLDTQTIDLEHNPRGYANRFALHAGNANGAGKPIDVQLAEITAVLDAIDSPVDIAIVEDYANSGRSIVDRFAPFLTKDSYSLTAVVCNLNTTAAARLEEYGIATIAEHTFDTAPAKYMDHSDLIPTLGGRALGIMQPSADNSAQVCLPFTIDGIGSTLVAVDAVTGNYPWQVDLYSNDMTPSFRRALYAHSLQTAHAFWDYLERAHHGPLTWQALTALRGIARIFYPMKDKQHVHIPAAAFAETPYQAIKAIGEYDT